MIPTDTFSPAPTQTRSGLALSFRPLEAADIAPVMALESQLQSHPWRRSSYEDCLAGRHHCWLAEASGELVGFVVVAWAGGDGELLNIAVASQRQRQGVGERLLALAFELVRPHASMMFLEVRLSNRNAIQFYEREQFFEVGQRPNYYPSARGREDALILARQL
ncbi:ribosomal protein S18-alanine N-acetyltransferase [Marinimicrobium agarilyticum]|uniref:ribosomal protein S18-alanine N-acetyltransferase n=1 Tax=Marinimicrobium agarilyticum TaxID=306546 RepID=UPI0003F81CB5|nr:ribosomal protein S18-alanine N-acetyltransferase [Marinimicrobium agarilyticum]